MKRLNEEKLSEIERLAKAGHGRTSISRHTGLSPITVKKYCGLHSIDVQPAVIASWTETMIDEAVRLYGEGHSARQVSSLMGRGYRQTQSYLAKRGVQSRGRGSKGELNYFWQSGKTVDRHGYILVHSPNHPYRDRHSRVRQHRLVMEQTLGRYLNPVEVVDHENGVTNDNRPGNLRLFASNAAHLAATLKGKTPKWTAEGRARLLAARRGFRLRRKLSRSILGAVQLRRSGVHRCVADTCPLYEIGLAHRREQQRSRARAWRRRETERRLRSVQAQF